MKIRRGAGRCWPRCETFMNGVALVTTYTAGDDDLGGEAVTISPGGPGKLVRVKKCVLCGESVRWGADRAVGATVKVAAPGA